MKSKFITDPQDPSDCFLYTAGAEVYTSFWPSAGQDGGNLPASTPVEIPSTPALTSEAVAASGAQSGPTSTVSMTTGGITINLLFDAAAMAAPASFRAGIQQAASLLTAAISDKITVNIKIDYSGTGGGAAAGPDSGQYLSYSTVKSDLINNATPGDTTFNALPGGSSIQGQSNVAVWNAQLKLWGVLGANDTTTDDGSATFATDINSNLLVGVALHELTHAMGRVPYGPPYSSSPDIFDLFRFTSPGMRMFITAPAPLRPPIFLSTAALRNWPTSARTSDPSDFLNSGVQGPNDPFNEFYTGGTLQSFTTVDKEQLDALGFHTATAGQPDLTEYVSIASTTLAAGAATTVDAYAINRGNLASGASTAGIYLSTDANITTSDVLLTTVDSSTLSANGLAGYVDHHAGVGNAAQQPCARHLLHRWHRRLQQPGRREQRGQQRLWSGPDHHHRAGLSRSDRICEHGRDDGCGGRHHDDRCLCDQPRRRHLWGFHRGHLSVDRPQHHHIRHAARHRRFLVVVAERRCRL